MHKIFHWKIFLVDSVTTFHQGAAAPTTAEKEVGHFDVPENVNNGFPPKALALAVVNKNFKLGLNDIALNIIDEAHTVEVKEHPTSRALAVFRRTDD
jgi:hypothetical protein